ETLDQIAFLVEVLVIRDGLRARAARRDHGPRADFCHGGAKAIGVKAHVGEQVFERKTADQALSLANVVDFARSQDEADRMAKGIDADADLRAQAAARTPDRLIFAPPF